jgi:hypothetical protein
LVLSELDPPQIIPIDLPAQFLEVRGLPAAPLLRSRHPKQDFPQTSEHQNFGARSQAFATQFDGKSVRTVFDDRFFTEL